MNQFSRRQFLGQAAAIAGCAAAGVLEGCEDISRQPYVEPDVSLNWDRSDLVAGSLPAEWGITQLAGALHARGVSLGYNQPGRFRISISTSPLAGGAESIAVTPGEQNLSIKATDARGLIYALTDLAERVTSAPDAKAALRLNSAIIERPANRIRSITRLFVSDVEDKAWFHDRDFWRDYLTMLATERFNRFNLALGLGYDAPRGLRDTYFYFAYPFLLDVPGYSVRARGLPDEERDRNLQTLRFISTQAALRGLQFQLGLWTHGYQWEQSPDANYVIDGLTPATQAPYCRDALHMLLEECPAITGVTLRIHGESGVPEGDYDFWRMLFGGIARTGRKIELDLHAKGIDQQMIDVALESGLPVTVSPKFWAEHMGLPYMPASIRQTEMPTGRTGTGLYSLSNGSRSFMRYSYGDLLKADRRYGILHRVWPGTQRLLLWGDPKFAAAYGRAFGFCGSDGVEFFDPLSFKGRKGSGLPGGRDGYADISLRALGGDWRKFLYTYRSLGRLTYNPDAEPEVWQRGLRREFGASTAAVEAALSPASRILPLITSSHDPSAANYNYWPEMYLNMSIVDGSNPGPYTDTPRPRDFCHVSALDPQLFATVRQCADALLRGKPIGKYTPLNVARQLEDWARLSGGVRLSDPACRRVAVDCKIVAGIGAFFAWKFRVAVLFCLFESTGDERARNEAVRCYRLARSAWADGAAAANGAYVRDITFGPDRQMRGDWEDRLAAMDRDIASLQDYPGPDLTRNPYTPDVVAQAINAVLDFSSPNPAIAAQHTPPASFRRGSAIDVELRGAGAAKLWYRRVDQSEVFQSLEMSAGGDVRRASIPGAYTDSPFAIQYYFEIEPGRLFPGLGEDFAGVPYFVVPMV